MPEGLIGKLKMLPKLAEMGAFFPKIVSGGPCQEVVRTRQFFAARFPDSAMLARGRRAASSRCRWSFRAIPTPASATAACTACRSSTSAPPGMHWQTHKQGAEHYRRMSASDADGEAHGRGRGHRRRPGHHVFRHPAAAARSGRDDDRRLPARQSPVEMVKCQTCDLEVPANAEIVLEGYVELGELRTEGPFGDHTGFYSLADEYPVFHVTCITHRKKPDLRDHHRRPAAHGGLLHGQGHRAHFPAADAPATARGARHRHAAPRASSTT